MFTSHVIVAAQVVSELKPNASMLVIASTIIYSFVNLQPSLEIATKLDGATNTGCLWHGFHDACKEGDGDRIVRY